MSLGDQDMATVFNRGRADTAMIKAVRETNILRLKHRRACTRAGHSVMTHD